MATGLHVSHAIEPVPAEGVVGSSAAVSPELSARIHVSEAMYANQAGSHEVKNSVHCGPSDYLGHEGAIFLLVPLVPSVEA